jgi:serine/threonine protein kinase
VDILHVGRNDEAGYFYYVMELADDESDEPEPVTAESPGVQTQTELEAARSHATSRSSRATQNFDPDTYAPKTLRSELKRLGRLPVLDCLRIGASLSEALEHLHENGLVHRDIKPSNVIFVNGLPKLADIGLVAPSDATLSFVGTEG